MLLVNTSFLLVLNLGIFDNSAVDRVVIVIDVFAPGEKILKE